MRPTPVRRTHHRSLGRFFPILLTALVTLLLAACTVAQPSGPSAIATPTAGVGATPTLGPPSAVSVWAAAAAGEGEVRVHADLSQSEIEGLTRVFRKRHPGLTVVWTLGLDRDLLGAILSRAEADPDWDVFVGDVGTQLKGAGLAERWSPPEAAALPAGYADSEGAWHAVGLTYHVLQYHTELVPPAARPTRYDQLADARLLGRLAVEEGALGWLKGLTEAWGRQATIDLLKPLASQGVVSRRGPRMLADFVSAGQHAVAVANRIDAVERARRGGAKTGWVAIEPVVVQPTVAVVALGAPHPNAARVFADFLLSADAQVLLAAEGRVPSRSDVAPEPQGLGRGLRTHFTLPAEGAAERDLAALYADLWRPR